MTGFCARCAECAEMCWVCSLCWMGMQGGRAIIFDSHLMQIDIPAHSALCAILSSFYGYGVFGGRKWLGACLSAPEVAWGLCVDVDDCLVVNVAQNGIKNSLFKGSSWDPFSVRVISCAETKKPAEAGFNARTLSYQLLELVGNWIHSGRQSPSNWTLAGTITKFVWTV